MDGRNRFQVNALAALVLADSYLARKEWSRAEQIYKSMIRQAPKSETGYLKMGISRKLQRKPGEASAYFAQAMERNPKDLTAVNEYIFALAAAREVEKARGILEHTLEEDPKNPQAWDLAGRYYLCAGKPAEAEASFLKAIELAPDFFGPY